MRASSLILLCIQIVLASEKERQLYADLRKKYEPLERPVKNSSQPVIVYLGITLNQIIDVSERDQIIKTNSWLNFAWNDVNMVWDPAQYNGITDVRLPYGTLWRPDVLLYNSVDSNFDSTYQSNFVVYSDGTINWIPPGIFEISCKIDITWFPFDEQRCFFKFGSWTYDGTKLDLQPDENGWDLSEYMINGEWNLYHTEVKRDEKFYECCPEPYPSLYFNFHMKRRTLYYGFNLIIPCMLITLITLLGFILPPDSGEKIGLQITVMLSISFFLEIVSNMSPETSEAVPLLGTFFSTCMFVVSASVVMTVVVLNFHHRNADTHEMGEWTQCILLEWLPWTLCMSRPGKKIRRSDLRLPSNLAKCLCRTKELEEGNASPLLNSKEDTVGDSYDDDGIEARIHKCLKVLATHSIQLDPAQQAQLMLLHRIYVELNFITHRLRDEDEAGEKQNDWRFAAMVIDRLCLVLFSFFIAISTFYIFFTAPYLTA